MISEKRTLEDMIQEAVAEYCYKSGDRDFDAVVHISAEDGWTGATIEED